MVSTNERSEIVFFDLETTVPTRPGQGFGLIEFGAILVCPRKLVELESYSTLLRPTDLSLISNLSVRSNGISKEAVVSSPTFAQITDRVYDILHGRIWAGHNIVQFDCARIREAFAEIERPPPEPKGTIDTYVLLTERFGRRAGDMKMATLATYFGLGRQTHRSYDDVRMNLEVLKYCATVLFLESPNAITRSLSNGKVSPDGIIMNRNISSSSVEIENQQAEGNHPILSLMTPNTGDEGPDRAEFNGYACFLEPDEVSVPLISVSLAPFYRGTQRIQILHKDITLQLCCIRLKVRFGINMELVDFAGRPRLNFVVDATPNLCRVLDACDSLSQRLSVDSGSSSEWRPVVARKPGFWKSPTVRLQIPYSDGNFARWVTEIYHKESSNSPQRLVFDVEELDTLLTPGTNFVDAYFYLDPYDYKQNAGILLKAKKLILHSN